MASVLCEICGNELEPGKGRCPHCGTPCTPGQPGTAGPPHRVINLERGMPLVRQALDRLDAAIATAGHEGVRALTLIHGYGSSGTGGAIREAVRHQLQFYRLQGRIREIVPGEELAGRSRRGRQFLRRFPFLAGHRDLNRANPGITLIIL
ncbi:Smr/MutS family protein [Desulfobulbus elongatus]|uniref:Smr/MutS family protein n=1 Tax=Desulfobulbus elongatus TaxID=53332 RepID=UPI00068621A7|nr:Smr/MutS family protein [Desulfobulbus elongatus]